MNSQLREVSVTTVIFRRSHHTMMDVTNSCKDMDDSRATHRDTHSRLACQITICCCSVSSSLFVAKTDESNAAVQALLADISHRKTRCAKNDLDSKLV